MRSVARFVVARARLVLAATLVVTAGALLMFPRLSFDLDVTAFLTDSNVEGRAFARMQARYGATDPITVLLTRQDGGRFDDRAGMVLVAQARDALAALPEVASVGSFLPETVPLLGGPVTPSAIAALPALALVALRAGPTTEILVSQDAASTMLVVQPAGDAIAAVRAVQGAAVPEALDVTLAGNPVVYAEVLDLLGWFLIAIPPLVLVVLILVFTATLGHPRLAVLALLPALLGSVWTFGVLFAFRLEISLVTVIVPVFVIVMGSADGLHFVAHLQDARRRGLARTDAVAAALAEVGVPMILTTVSTAAGFLSLVATGVLPIAQLGAFVAIGIALAGVISWFALPAAMTLLFERMPAGKRTPLGAHLDAGVARLASRRWVAWALVTALVAFAAIFAPRLKVDADPLFYFPADHPVRQGFERVAAAFGGATPLFGEFAIDPERPVEEQLAPLRDASRALEELPGIRAVVSLADILPRVPVDQRAAVLSGERPLPFGRMATEDGLRFVVLTADYDSADVAVWRAAAAAMPEVRVFSGTPMLFAALASQIARAQAVSLGLAFALVALLMWAVYRRVDRALLSLAPITLTVAVVLGFVSATGMNLNLITVVASSIVLGVGIDYAIHLIAAIEVARRADPDAPGWVRRGLHAATRPIAANALGIAIGLTALQLSPLRPHHQISALMWVGMVVAALTTLVVIPAASPRRGMVDAVSAGTPPAPPPGRTSRAPRS